MNDDRWDVQLVKDLMQLADQKKLAALAHLRRGLERPPDYVLGRIGWLFRRVPEQDEQTLRNAILAAALFAWVKGSCPQAERVNFGAAFGSGLTLEGKQQREKRFIDLLDTDEKEIAYKLRQAITLIGKAGIGLDWVQFIIHLDKWNHPDRWVQKEWARGFWSAPLEDVATVPETLNTES